MAVALPSRSTATCGSQELVAASESRTGAVHAPPAGREALVTIQAEPSFSCQSAVALPARSTAIAGVSKTSPRTRSSGADQAPPRARDAVCTPYEPPTKLPQTAVTVPAGSFVTRGLARGPAEPESSTGALHVPPAGRVAAWSEAPAAHTAVALPAGSTVTSVVRAGLPAGERSTGADQVPSADRVADWTVNFHGWPGAPSKRDQVAVTTPASPTASCGTSVRSLKFTDGSVDRSTGALHAPPSGREEVCTTLLSASTRRQMAVALPAGSTTSCGSRILRPPARSSGALQAPATGRYDACTTYCVPL